MTTARGMERLRWQELYREAELYKAAVRVYTKPLFQWRKALSTSTDGRTLYDLAGRGLRSLDAMHRALGHESFEFRPAVALKYNFNGKRRTLYIPPWEERIVDLLLYRLLTRKLHAWFSPNSYAYRDRSYGLDRCQARIAGVMRAGQCRPPEPATVALPASPIYLVKRDITDYFGSVDHGLLLAQLAALVEPGDYLFRLLAQRVRFLYQDESGLHQATVGIPFGASIACLFANIFLTDLDRAVERIPGVHYFRYADDILVLAAERSAAACAREVLERVVSELRLQFKSSLRMDLAVGPASRDVGPGLSPAIVASISDRRTAAGDRRYSPADRSPAPQAALKDGPTVPEADLKDGPTVPADADFAAAREFRHLGLLFRADGGVALSRDKSRKIQNLFRFAFRRARRKWSRISNPEVKAKALVEVALETIQKGVRNVAILDYYLKHVDDEQQLRRLDRWLAEEVLARVFGGHKKGHFRRIGFDRLRALGLPSLVHRRRLIRRGKIASAFFVWQREKVTRAFRGTVARRHGATSGGAAFSPLPEAAVSNRP